MMRKTNSYFLLFILMLIICEGCLHEDPNPRISHWSAINSEADSINDWLEFAFDEDIAADSILKAVSNLEILRTEDKNSHNGKLDGRILYWKSRYELRNNHTDSALMLLKLSVEHIDSGSYPYDYYRIMNLLLPLDQSDRLSAYDFYFSSLKYARQIKDAALESRSYVNLASLFGQAGEAERSLQYFEKADSVYASHSLDRLIVKNRINKANALISIGKRDEAVQTLHSVITDVSENDPSVRRLALKNLFLFTDSVNYLYDLIKNSDVSEFNSTSSENIISYGLISYWWIRHGNIDSAKVYSDRSIEMADSLIDPNHKAIMYLVRSIIKQNQNEYDSAYMYRIAYEMEMDSAIQIRKSTDITRLNALKDVKTAESRHLSQLYEKNILIIVLSGLFLLIIFLYTFWVSRQRNRQHIAEMKKELALARIQKQMDVANITIESQERVLTYVKDTLKEKRQSGIVPDADSLRLEQEIRLLLSESEESKIDKEMYEIIHPDFFDRLRTHSQGLDQSYIKIAVYTLLELDNKKIGRLMNIKPESVRQSKWRLRNKLNVPSEISLEQFLKDLNS